MAPKRRGPPQSTVISPKRSAPPPLSPGRTPNCRRSLRLSREETASSSAEEVEIDLASPTSAQNSTPKKDVAPSSFPPTADAAEDGETPEEEDEEPSGQDAGNPQPAEEPPAAAPSISKPLSPKSKSAPESGFDAGVATNAEPDPAFGKTRGKVTAGVATNAEPVRELGKTRGEVTADPGKKKAHLSPSVEAKNSPSKRTWSAKDELVILEALANYAEKHGSLPLADALVASLRDHLDKSCNRKELSKKIGSLKRKFDIAADKAKNGGTLPVKEHDMLVYDLSMKIWGEKSSNDRDKRENGSEREQENGSEREQEDGSEREQEDGSERSKGECSKGDVNASDVPMDYHQLCKLYPNLSEVVNELEKTNPRGRTIRAAFEWIGDAKARKLEKKIKKQNAVEIEQQMRLRMRREVLIKDVADALVGLLNVD